MGKSVKCLLAVEVYEFTGDDIGKLRKLYEHNRYLSGILPIYTFNKEFGNIIHADGYLQFVDEGEEKYVLFNVSTVDTLLNEEISDAGLENLLEGSDIRPYIDRMQKKTYDEFERSLSSSEYLVIGLHYSGGQSYCDDDFEMHCDVVGALVGNNLDLVTIPNEKEHGNTRP